MIVEVAMVKLLPGKFMMCDTAEYVSWKSI